MFIEDLPSYIFFTSPKAMRNQSIEIILIKFFSTTIKEHLSIQTLIIKLTL
jgi:hypothetical protein